MSTDISVGIRAPHDLFDQPIEQIADFARAVDASGLEQITVGDHVNFHGGQGYDGLIQSALLVGLTRRAKVSTAVYLLPLRHPVPVARQVLSVAQVADGRLNFGVGVGGDDPEEFASCGLSVRRRGRRTDDALAIVRPILNGEPAQLDSEFFSIPETRLQPAPSYPVPILIGGRADAAMRRVARYGDGWMAAFVSPRRVSESLGQIADLTVENGRDPSELEHSLVVWCGFDSDSGRARASLATKMEALYRRPFTDFERYSPYGTPRAVADALTPYVDVGVRSFHIIPAATDSTEALEAVVQVREHLLAR